MIGVPGFPGINGIPVSTGISISFYIQRALFFILYVYGFHV